MIETLTALDSKGATVAETHSGLWFVRRNGDSVEGPFNRRTLEKEIQIGQLDAHVEVRCGDGPWQPLADGDRQVASRTEAKTSADDVALNQPLPAASPLELRRSRRAQRWSQLRRLPADHRGPIIAVFAVLGVVLMLALWGTLPQAARPVDCTAAPGPAVNWDFCERTGIHAEYADLARVSARNANLVAARFARADLSQADLAYADLTGADMSLARLNNSRLVGASLRHARLNHADLSDADLRFADLSGAAIPGASLRGARLGSAIWTDGRICARQSVGRCR